MNGKLIGVTLVTLVLAMGPAWGQAQSAANPDETVPAPWVEPDFTEEQLRRFAEAVWDVHEVTQGYAPRIEAAPTEEEQEALLVEALHQAIEAVEEAGLTLEEYDQIAEAVEEDPALAQQVNELVRQAGADPDAEAPSPQSLGPRER
jgi:hypothetical protein